MSFRRFRRSLTPKGAAKLAREDYARELRLLGGLSNAQLDRWLRKRRS